MKLLLTGASSYLGARLFFDLSKRFDVIGTYSSTWLSGKFIHLDVTDPEEIVNVVKQNAADIIIHAANNASAKWCDAHPVEAVTLNQRSTERIVREANRIGAKVIYISSLSALDRSNVYGKTKYESERIVKQSSKNFVILRSSLVLGFSPNATNDRPFNRILKNLDARTPAVYDTSWKFQPTYIGHISEVILQVIKLGIWNQTIPVAVPELKSRYDVAADILNPFGITATPADLHDTTKPQTGDMSILTSFHLPTYSYRSIIKHIIGEIRNREKFII
ncbi:MAG TPA: sugar nucleotide-binding protein [Patescibacteria group bacterium]|nr:sugar nucleotide-binding protein [Patescibacteria group bacterium]